MLKRSMYSVEEVNRRLENEKLSEFLKNNEYFTIINSEGNNVYVVYTSNGFLRILNKNEGYYKTFKLTYDHVLELQTIKVIHPKQEKYIQFVIDELERLQSIKSLIKH